jgi:hypothetical protein
VKPEKKLYHLFKKNCPDLLITPLEVWNNLGVPDLLLYNKNVGFFMVELKIQNGNKIKFSPHQILFHTLRTKILALRAPLSLIKLYGSESIKDLSENPDRATPLAVDNWQAINNIFLKKIISRKKTIDRDARARRPRAVDLV